MYPLNWPFSIILGSIGVPIYIKVIVIYDDEAKVYIATSPNLRGLVVEAETLDEIKTEVENCVSDLIAFKYGKKDRDAKQTYLKFSASSQLKHA